MTKKTDTTAPETVEDDQLDTAQGGGMRLAKATRTVVKAEPKTGPEIEPESNVRETLKKSNMMVP